LAHPDSLLITASNKMRAGEKVKFRQNFSGRLLESYIVSADRDVNSGNFELIEKAWRNGFGGGVIEETSKGVIIRNVAVEQIEDFLLKFNTHSDFSPRKADIVAYLRTLSEKQPVGDVLLISPRGGNAESFKLNDQIRATGGLSGSTWHLNKDRVASRGDEKLGLSEMEQAAARALAAADNKSAPSDTHFREIRMKPLLMIHSLRPNDETRVKGPIAAFGVSFPPGHYETEIEVVANKVWLDRMHGEPDDPDDEEDYDA